MFTVTTMYKGLVIGGHSDGELREASEALIRIQIPLDPGPLDLSADIDPLAVHMPSYELARLVVFHTTRAGFTEYQCFWLVDSEETKPLLTDAERRHHIVNKLAERYHVKR